MYSRVILDIPRTVQCFLVRVPSPGQYRGSGQKGHPTVTMKPDNMCLSLTNLLRQPIKGVVKRKNKHVSKKTTTHACMAWAA